MELTLSWSVPLTETGQNWVSGQTAVGDFVNFRDRKSRRGAFDFTESNQGLGENGTAQAWAQRPLITSTILLQPETSLPLIRI